MSDFLVAEGRADSGGTRWFDLRDRETGAIRRVFLWAPKGDAPKDGWPSLIMTDGNAVIGTAVDAMRAQAAYPTGTNMGWGVLIAVGYPTDDAYDPFRRSWDLGPPPGRSYPPFWPETPEVRTGGGAEMARFILEDVWDFVSDLVPLDPKRRGLFGHSFGGLFALWLMMMRPDAFTHVIAASPAIMWEDGFLLNHLRKFDPGGRALHVHLSAGEWEGDRLAPFQVNAPDAETRLAEKKTQQAIKAAQEMAAALSNHAGVTAEYETYAGETHMSVLPVAVNRALQTTFSLRGMQS